MRSPGIFGLRIVVLFLSVTASVTTLADEAVPDRPNILWIYLEDVSGWFSCYGDTVIETPHIDSLAASGIRFTRFYTPAGVCSATRSAIITGMMQTSIGAHQHRSCRPAFRGQTFVPYDKNVLPNDVVPLPIRLRQAGYWTFNDGGKDDYNFEFRFEDFYDVPPKRGGWGPKHFLSGAMTDGKAEDQPFFGQLQLGGGKLGKRAPQQIEPAIVPVPPYYPDVEEVRVEIAHHYDCLLETDAQVGQVLDYLEQRGWRDNTVIFLFSDHGMKLHRHKQFLYEGGIQMPLIVAGPPIAGTTLAHAPETRRDLVSGIDITAASLVVAGQEIPDAMEGRNFLAEDHEPRPYVVAARDRCDWTIDHIRALVTTRFKYLRNSLPDRPYMQSSYKDSWTVSIKMREMMAAGEMNEAQRVFFSDDRPPEELYDLQNDPHEIHNLAGDSRFAETLNRHRTLLDHWIEQTGDHGQTPESLLGLRCVLARWGDKCVNPEYAPVRAAIAAKTEAEADASTAGSGSP